SQSIPLRNSTKQKALALFDIGSQSSSILKELANRLGSDRTKGENLELFSFGSKTPKSCQTTKLEIEVRTLDSEIIIIDTYELNYPTEKLQ
ncbi:hypothetical protein WUBG_14409, partial [Wuchereria bancrofti]